MGANVGPHIFSAKVARTMARTMLDAYAPTPAHDIPSDWTGAEEYEYQRYLVQFAERAARMEAACKVYRSRIVDEVAADDVEWQQAIPVITDPQAVFSGIR